MPGTIHLNCVSCPNSLSDAIHFMYPTLDSLFTHIFEITSLKGNRLGKERNNISLVTSYCLEYSYFLANI